VSVNLGEGKKRKENSSKGRRGMKREEGEGRGLNMNFWAQCKIENISFFVEISVCGYGAKTASNRKPSHALSTLCEEEEGEKE
jgi:hypothetical protein